MKEEKLTAQGLRRRYYVSAGVAGAVLVALIAYGVLRPGKDDGGYSDIREAMLSDNPDSMSQEKREELRKAFEKLSPETREKLVTEVMRQRLYEARERMKDKSREQKVEAVDKMIADFRDNFSKLDEEQKAQIKERINSPEGKERMKKSLDFYYTEFNPDERDLLDPFVNEVLMSIDKL